MDAMPDVTRFFHPVLPAHALKKKPLRTELAGRAYALFRDGTGKAAALADACPHRFAPLSAGRVTQEGRLACPYHGWNFDAAGHGRSPSQPDLKKCDARAFQLIERYGYLWLAAHDAPLSAFPDFAPEGFELTGSFSMLFRAPLHVALDNFSEDEHTPFVHTRLGWDAQNTDAIEFSAENHDDRTEVHYRAPQRSSLLIQSLLLRPGDFFHNDWVTHFNPVRTGYSIHWRSSSGELRPFHHHFAIFMVPETPHTTRFHVFAFLKLVDPRFRPLMPVVRKAQRALAWFEIRDDARFIPTVAGTPYSLKGMRLGKYDKPIIHQRKLLERIYFAQSPEEKVSPLSLVQDAGG
ncbi:Rieske 2Fe-2S domain-containing protein [Stigmatella sp. ncwal1]|uniref:Rieske 2Fe-2S domain-containing protein n=1 Tax=Stigmatella ashevillensis TaxID=2995309 RepID=A0ABT5D368_9BACT|nr:Rieske 2Fe-2S domain-containing protein [Stigmatella ashevillena]MDC0707540.1 Rieske 2Fe-2S domain-containing protein [Stigmatella ashevillena]